MKNKLLKNILKQIGKDDKYIEKYDIRLYLDPFKNNMGVKYPDNWRVFQNDIDPDKYILTLSAIIPDEDDYIYFTQDFSINKKEIYNQDRLFDIIKSHVEKLIENIDITKRMKNEN